MNRKVLGKRNEPESWRIISAVGAVTEAVNELPANVLPKPSREAVTLCAGHAQQLGGESPLANLMEVKA